jgi:hypothetical protein
MADGYCQQMYMDCFTCHGVGTVSDDYPERKARAERFRRARIDHYASLQECGRALGIDYALLSRRFPNLRAEVLARIDGDYPPAR